MKDRVSLEFWKVFISVICTLSSIVTLVSFVFQWHCPSWWMILSYLFGIFVIAVAVSMALTHRKKSLRLHISNTLDLSVIPGDIFSYHKANNVIVIPVNEYFDTKVDNKIISESSIHGQFINNFFRYKHQELHEEIELFLSRAKIEAKEVVRPKSEGYTKCYPLGTCAKITVGQTDYVLLALTHFDDDDHAFVELSEFGRCISKLCKYLSSNYNGNLVYMPLMGMGLSRLNQPGQSILRFTLDTIVGIKDLALMGGLNIVVDENVAKTLDLNEIRY